MALAAAASGVAVAQLVGAKAARDALFLSHHDVSRLPEMMAAAAFVSLLSAMAFARAMARWAPARVLPVALVANAVLCAVDWLVVERAPRGAAVLFYLQVAFLGASLSAGTWALINECFDPHTAKKVVGRIAMGGTAGGALGGLLGLSLGRLGGVPAMLGVLALLNLVAVVPVLALGRHAKREPTAERPSARSGFDVLQQHPYLRKLALLVVMVAVTSALLDYVLSARIVGHVGRGPDLVAVFALFHTGVGLASFAIQALATRPALGRLGLSGTMSLLPISVLGAGLLALVSPALWSAVLVRGIDALVQSSLYRAAYELAYTPIPRAEKRPAKMLIDVGFDRVGTALGSGLVLQVLPRVADAENVLLLLTLSISAISVFTAIRLHGGYVDALGRSLRRGAVKLDSRDVLDATTRRTLAETAGLDRKMILASIERRRASEADSVPPTSDSPPDADAQAPLPDVREEGFGPAPVSLRFGAEVEPEERSEIGRALDDLRSGSPSRARAVLERERELEPELVPAALELLGNDELSRHALRALRRSGERITGTLVDALRDERVSVVVRRRIPRALESLADLRAAQGLTDALFAPELEVRRQAAFALQRQAALPGAPELSSDRVFAAVEQELLRGVRELSALGGDEERRQAALASLEHAIVVLSLVLEREPLGLAYRALGSEDQALRGTALEYFETVLPEALRGIALPLFNRLAPQGRTKRDTKTLRDELLRTRSG